MEQKQNEQNEKQPYVEPKIEKREELVKVTEVSIITGIAPD